MAQPADDDVTRADLADGWSIEAVGPVVYDNGWTEGHTSSASSIAFAPATPQVDVDRALADVRREEAELADRQRLFRVTVRRGDIEVVVHEEHTSIRDGGMQLHWPPFVSRHGLLLRRTSEDARDASGRVQWGRETLSPWLIEPDGAVRTLPFALGVGPLCELPDGRWLLPGADALWRDSSAEPLSALALDGQVESLQFGDDTVDTARLVAALAPDWMPEVDADRDEYEFLSEFPWAVIRAAHDAASGELHLLLADAEPADGWEPLRWLLVAIALDGSASPRLIERGERPADTDADIPMV
jgi:hypothetical protein